MSDVDSCVWDLGASFGFSPNGGGCAWLSLVRTDSSFDWEEEEDSEDC